MNLESDEVPSQSIFAWKYPLWEIRLKLVTAGFLLYLGIFYFIHWLSSRVSVTYHSLSAKEKIHWNLTSTRAVFGIQSSVAGLWALLLDPVFQADKVYAQQDWSWFICLISSGYFLFENLLLFFRVFDLFLVTHHVLALCGFICLVTNFKSGHYIPLMGLLLETTATFRCISWILFKVGRAKTLFWKVNQYIWIHMSHCRMILTYHMWWVCISNWNAMLQNLGLLHFAVVFIGMSAITFVLNPYWTHKKTQQLYLNCDNRTLENCSSRKLQ